MNRNRLVASLLLVVALQTPARADSYVYLSIAGENRVAVYRREESSGQLNHTGDTTINGEPGALATDPQRRYLFASIRSEGKLVSFAIDQESGELTTLDEISAGSDPAYVAVDHTGTFLLTAYYQAAKVMVHRILANGRLAQPPVQELPTADKAHAIVTDRSNRYAFVPHTGPNVIFQFRFDARTGRLAPNSVPKVQRPEQTGPRHLLFHPSENFAYVSDEQGSSLSVYRFEPSSGTLEPLQSATTLPEGFSGQNSTAHLELHPAGSYVYVANRGHDSLASFAIDPATGRVKALGQTPTEGTPRSFSIAPSGAHLYAAGQATGRLAAFGIDTANGALTRLATYDVGDRPWWVLVVDLPPT